MGKMIKILTVLLFVITGVLFSLVCYGEKTIPDKMTITNAGSLKLLPVFTAEFSETEKQTVAEATNVDNFSIDVKVLGFVPVKTASVSVGKRQYVVAGGEVIGLKLYSDGVLVVGTTYIQTQNGQTSPAEIAGIKIGDILLTMDGKKVISANEVAQNIADGNGQPIEFQVSRENCVITLKLTPILSSNDGKYKAGLWIRDSAAGIGTVTYYDPANKIYASLGHAVCDEDTGDPIPVMRGEAVESAITGCFKGQSGCAGELCGVFTGKSIGNILVNDSTGCYGVVEKSYFDGEMIPVAAACEVREGKAQIECTVSSGEKKMYDVEIKKIYPDQNSTKNLCIKVTDAELIEKTGGIVQGMSGSPIIQNGMLVGAVTHVFINDPQQGYGIFAETMMKSSQALYDEFNNQEAA